MAEARGEPIDVRLGAGAGAAWLAVLGTVEQPAGVVLVAAVSAATVAVGVLVLGRRWAGAATVTLILFSVALVLIPLAGRIAHAAAGPLAALARQHARVAVTLVLTADPRALAATGPAGAPRVAVESSAQAVLVGGRSVAADGAVLVLAPAGPWHDLLPGQRVRVDGDLQPALDGDALSVTLFARSPPQVLGRPPWWQRAAGHVRVSLQQAVAELPAQERGLLPGLIDGDTSGLDPVLAERFKLAGLTHLVAVSGTNCSILVGALLLVLRRARARPWVCACVGAVGLAMFVVVARPSPSVLRAAVMAAIALAAFAVGRPRAALPALSAAVLALLILDPALAGTASFAMSVLATLALLVLAPGWAHALRDRGVPAFLAESVAVAAAAHLVTAPVVAAISGRVSLVAVPANVLAEPVVAPITIVGFAAALLAPFWLAGGAFLAAAAGWPCRWLVAVADHLGGLHGATVPWPGGAAGAMLLLGTAVVVLAACLRVGARRVLVAAAATALVIVLPVRAVTSRWPPPDWLFVACDVGQGDALLLPAGPRAAIEVDAGPDPVAIDRCLRDFGIERIRLLVLTHFHLDHVGGLPGVVRGRHIDRIITGPLADPVSGWLIAHRAATARGLALLSPPVGTTITISGVVLEVLGPPSAFHGTRSDPNNSSLVLRATLRGVRILLPGDAEIEAQRSLLDAGVDLRADVLKVPHHGSAYSDPAFLAAVHASLAIVSVGAHNDYGHPSPVLLAALARLGVPLLRTDRDGDVAVTGRRGHLTAIAHGVPASTVGQRRPGRPGRNRAGAGPERAAGTTVVSVRSAKMARCRPARSASTICQNRCRPSYCWSVRKNSWSSGPSARSPPRRAGPIRRCPRRNSPAASSKGPSCTRCSDRRCSGRRGCWWSARRKTSAPPPRLCWARTSPRRPTAPSSSCTTSAARKARPCSRRPERRGPSRSGAPSSPARTSGPTSFGPRCGARKATSPPRPSPRCWTRSAATCVSWRRSRASWSAMPAARSAPTSCAPTIAAGPR